MNMKMDNRMSVGNVITILAMAISIVSSWTMMGSQISVIDDKQNKINARMDLKSDKSVVDVKFQFIQQDLNEIKEMIKEL
tara:strand:- start:15672 stop:15911 length:240 start_codon:yes stop_codon:yes gene_type:complete